MGTLRGCVIGRGSATLRGWADADAPWGSDGQGHFTAAQAGGCAGVYHDKFSKLSANGQTRGEN